MRQLFPFLLIFIITVPAFIRLINNAYFPMHDDQHIVRLFLLDQAIRQEQWYPRWVDGLGFGFGYPLFNFYPPFIYYLALFFHYVGFSLIWSIKLVLITGFFAGAVGVYLFVKRLVGKSAGFISATIYTYFFYHAVTIYVRGALAEFFSMAILPFVFLAISLLHQKKTIRNSLLFGFVFSLLILTHPLIAFPTLFYMGFLSLFYMFICTDKMRFTKYFALGIILGLLLSAFFWLPSLIERQYTLTDDILTHELANYKIHYVYLQQFFYSLWGYGGSIAGPYDGMTFQLGKIPIGLAMVSIIFFIGYSIKRRISRASKYYLFFLFLFFFSLFMTTSYSAMIWDNVQYLWYLQFPWRFLTFVSFFIAVLAGYAIYFFNVLWQFGHPWSVCLYHLKMQSAGHLGGDRNGLPRGVKSANSLTMGIHRLIPTIITVFLIISIITIYQKYFTPQKFLWTNDQQLTTHDEITWRVSRSSFEFVPKGVTTKKTELNTTTLAIEKENIPHKQYEIINGQAQVSILENKFSDKQFLANVQTPIIFRLSTYHFPGWHAYIDNQLVMINNKNKYKLITISIPQGTHHLRFIFQDTIIRKIANAISILVFLILIVYTSYILLIRNKLSLWKK